jgi:hypothetical protein
MDALNALIKQEAGKSIKESNCVFSIPARVIAAYDNQKYRVQLITSDIEYTLINYTGSDLYMGETVQIFYRNNYISEQTAYIGAACTKSTGQTGGLKFRKCTQTEYDSIVAKDNNTVYYVVNNGKVAQFLGDMLVGGSFVGFDVNNGELDINTTGSTPNFSVDDSTLIVAY